MAATNHDDVVAQLRAGGLLFDAIEVGKMVRCRTVDSREKRGWYRLHLLMTKDGDELLVGSWGIWQADNSNATKIELSKTAFSPEQRESLRKRLAEDRKHADRVRQADAERAALAAAKAWDKCAPTGDAEYLARKGVAAHGVRFSPQGAVVIPMLDVAGRIHGLQLIHAPAVAKEQRRPEKEYWPKGLAKKSHFHLIGMPTAVLLVVEGYATGASLHEATGLPVAIAFDANNLAPVAAALHRRYKHVRILICADDDAYAKCVECQSRLVLAEHAETCPSCGKPHRRHNAGVTCASTAALEVSGAWARPQFADDDARRAAWMERGRKVTDFNDLHALEGLHRVRTQIEGRIAELGWRTAGSAAPRYSTSGARGEELKPIERLDELLDRFALVYGQGGSVFDRQEHCLLSLSDMRDACVSRDLHRAWAEHPERTIVRVREVGFDPAGEDPDVTCNLWAGWPTVPRAGRCERLLELLRYMCSNERNNSEALYRWVLRWIAYPIQHPGAKMRTTLVIHGPQGTGKNMFFEAVMSIYGLYGRIVDQSAIEDRFNDWASRKLLIIADEVIARSDLYHVKNKLKAFITGDWIRINPKNLAAYDERNHVNVVFLSNENMPVVLEEDDRRHAVIWTPAKLTREFYASVQAELEAGGVAALHHYLLHLDLGDFHPSTLPPLTAAKSELIQLSLDSTSRFYYALTTGDIEGVIARPALTRDLYVVYKTWCHRTGHRAAPEPKLVNALERKHDVRASRKRYVDGGKVKGPHGCVFLGDVERPPAAPETEWLGEQFAAFRLAVDDYKGQKDD